MAVRTPGPAATRPSALTPALAITQGRACRIVMKKAAFKPSRGLAFHVAQHVDAMRPQPREPLAGDLRVRILDRHHHS